MATEPLTPDNAAILLVDHQAGVFEYVKEPPREEVEANVVRLARAAATLEIPVILSTSSEQHNGALLPTLEQVVPDAYGDRIERQGVIDAMADPAVAHALSATGRSHLVTAGIGTDVCGIHPALHANRDGYQVTFVADACGTTTMFAQQTALRRLTHEGVTVATTASVIAELAGDYRSHAQIMWG